VPSVVNPTGRSRRLDTIYETWGPYARAIFVLHNQTEFPQGSHLTLSDTSRPLDHYRWVDSILPFFISFGLSRLITRPLTHTRSYPQTILLPSDIGINDGVPRLYHTIRTVFERVDPDFCFLTNDHTFVIPEHLCQYLEGRDPEQDLYAGHALRNSKTDAFNSGAAGYLLSRATMRKLVQKWKEKDPTCWVGPEASSWLQGNPGLVTVQCLNMLGVSAIDTRVEGKWHIFHAFPLTRVVAGKVDTWYLNKHDSMDELGYNKSYNTLLSGADCCAVGSVSFHYVEYKECRALFSTRQALLDNPNMNNDDLKDLMSKMWPTEFRDIGGYSRALPKPNDEQSWDQLLAVVRKISQAVPEPDC
jgi:hypothetical protein